MPRKYKGGTNGASAGVAASAAGVAAGVAAPAAGVAAPAGGLEVRYQLITDVDDTLHPAGSLLFGYAQIAGVDLRDRSTYYPCVAELHQEIFRKFGLPTVIVSANPVPPDKKKIADKTAHLHGEGENPQVVYHPGHYLSSAFSVGSNFVGRMISPRRPYEGIIYDADGYAAVARVKENIIRKHVKEMKEAAENAQPPYTYRAIWIGDNGQGDLKVAEKLLPESIIYAALIHYVEPRKDSGKEFSDKYRLFPFTFYHQAVQWLQGLDPNLEFLKCDKLTEADRKNHPSVVRQKSYDEAEAAEKANNAEEQRLRQFRTLGHS